MSKSKAGSKSTKVSFTVSAKPAPATGAASATVAMVMQNSKMLKKVDKLLREIKPECVTRANKADLDKIQLLIKNIQYRNFGVMERVRPVTFTARQKAIIRQVAGEAASDVPVAETEASTEVQCTTGDPQSSSTGAPQISVAFERIQLVPTRLK